MPQIVQYALIALAALALLTLVLFLLKVGFKTILKFIVNAALGIGAIFLFNLIPGVSVPVVWWTGLLSGLFGIPGAVASLIISFFL